ncbi:Hypothetical predicted protein [Paramuricea clavata]|uniref:Uncharacterized protein n=1 Tax=Paramuricea clavata TaxID=317549 RepID=A0A6S7GLH9_PARCT|nr:Hypothetical predicted protein [Paramuricea clavata]
MDMYSSAKGQVQDNREYQDFLKMFTGKAKTRETVTGNANFDMNQTSFTLLGFYTFSIANLTRRREHAMPKGSPHESYGTFPDLYTASLLISNSHKRMNSYSMRPKKYWGKLSCHKAVCSYMQILLDTFADETNDGYGHGHTGEDLMPTDVETPTEDVQTLAEDVEAPAEDDEAPSEHDEPSSEDDEAPAEEDDHENVIQISSKALLDSHSLVDVCLRHVCSFWFCGQKPSCGFLCTENEGYVYQMALAAWRAIDLKQPICESHHKPAKFRVVKDIQKESYGRPYFTCAERENPCSLWMWADEKQVEKQTVITDNCVS